MSLSLNTDPLLEDLNEAQRAAVTHGEGPLLVLAGAGTGKTRVLTRRIAWLIATRKAAPSEILGLTFTDKAAQEMEERVDRLVPFGYTDMTLVTFHALGHRLLSEFGMLLGLPAEPRVLTQAETVVFLRERLFKLPLDRLRPLGDPTKHLDEFVRHFGRLADEDIAPEAYAAFAAAERAAADAAQDAARLDRAGIWSELAACYRAYLDLLAKRGRRRLRGPAHDDAPAPARAAGGRVGIAAPPPAGSWSTSSRTRTSCSSRSCARSRGERPNLTVVGDDDQSIYKFRGASISNILDFQTIYPDCATHVLVENYRSTAADPRRGVSPRSATTTRSGSRCKAACRQAPASRAGRSPTARTFYAQGFDSPSTEADHVAARIQAAVESGRRRHGDFAVLVRRHAATDPVVRALALAGIPFRVAGGGGLYDRPEVIACLDALAAMSDPTDDRALFFLAASEIYDVPALAISELRKSRRAPQPRPAQVDRGRARARAPTKARPRRR